jgi:hypothetical protein
MENYGCASCKKRFKSCGEGGTQQQPAAAPSVGALPQLELLHNAVDTLAADEEQIMRDAADLADVPVEELRRADGRMQAAANAVARETLREMMEEAAAAAAPPPPPPPPLPPSASAGSGGRTHDRFAVGPVYGNYDNVFEIVVEATATGLANSGRCELLYRGHDSAVQGGKLGCEICIIPNVNEDGKVVSIQDLL